MSRTHQSEGMGRIPCLFIPRCGCVLLMVMLVAFDQLSVDVSAFAPKSLITRQSPASVALPHCHRQLRISPILRRLMQTSSDSDGDDDFIRAEIPDESSERIPRSELEQLTVAQLQQQLRLRGLPVSGQKEELVDRISGSAYAGFSFTNEPETEELVDTQQVEDAKEKAKRLAKEQGIEPIDVTAYLDEDDAGKEMKAYVPSAPKGEDDVEDFNPSTNEEVWGAEARIIDDFEDTTVVVDNLSRTVVEFLGSNQTYCQALVMASRDALKPFLRGGYKANNMTKAEERVREIQMKREISDRRPKNADDHEGVDGGDETGLYANVLDRDYSDWGKFTQTGAQISAAEVQGVILLSDVYGAFDNSTRALAEKIAFECQPVVVMVPDLFRGNPWTGPTDGVNEKGQTYEAWRAEQDDLRVSVDIRAAAASLRSQYGVSSVVLWGTCYGGGRALEAASGVLPGKNVHDVDGNVGPPNVDPVAVVAWYPTRYNAPDLFGAEHKGTETDINGKQRKMAIMGVFASEDTIPGATPDDAAELKQLLAQDFRVHDHMVKVFSGQVHGFAHQGLGQPVEGDDFERFVDEEFGGAGRTGMSGDDAEVACLLSTAFMETYSRVFLPTVGPPISADENEAQWGQSLDMEQHFEQSRDIRAEIEDALDNFEGEPLGGRMIDQGDEAQQEELKRILISMESPKQKDGPFAIESDDNIETVYAKLKAADPDFQIF